MLLAQSTNLLAQVSNPAINYPTTLSGVNFFQSFLSAFIGVGFVVGVLVFIFVLVLGAISWITAGGDKGKLEDARKRITSAIIGILILFGFYVIVNLLGCIFRTNLVGFHIGQLNVSFYGSPICPVPQSGSGNPGPSPSGGCGAYCDNTMTCSSPYSCNSNNTCTTGTTGSCPDGSVGEICWNLVDDNQNGYTDCQEASCDGQYCGPNGATCQNGACSGPPPAPTSSVPTPAPVTCTIPTFPTGVNCIDSDGGLNYGTPGYVVIRNTNACNMDSCSNSTLFETYCTNSATTTVSTLAVFCPNGCLNGACVGGVAITPTPVLQSPTPAPTGTGSSCTTIGHGVCMDYNSCFMAQGNPRGSPNDCPGNDVCCTNIPTPPTPTPTATGTPAPTPTSSVTCTDTDGGTNYYVAGYVYTSALPNSHYTDSCSGTTLYEYDCVNNGPQSSTYTCPQACAYGACVAFTPTPPPPTATPTRSAPTPTPSCQIYLNHTNLVVPVGYITPYTASVYNAVPSYVAYSSSNTAVASVSPTTVATYPYNTQVRTLTRGTTTIRADVYIGNIIGCYATSVMQVCSNTGSSCTSNSDCCSGSCASGVCQ